jgi:enoyl-CoA hydratase/carnithine racemase
VTYVETSIANEIAVLTFDRSSHGNAIDCLAYQNIRDALMDVGKRSDVHAVVLRAAGVDFSIGEDFEYLADLESRGELDLWRRTYRGFIETTWHLPQPVIAEVRGRALGIGCELALLADVTYASDNAVFGHPEVAIGMVAPTVWPWLCGPKLAKEYIASGRLISAAEAVRVRLINGVFAASDLTEAVDALARDFASMPPGAAGANKRVLNWAFRDVSRVLLDDLNYIVDFGWLNNSRSTDTAFYADVRSVGMTEALRRRNARFSDGH